MNSSLTSFRLSFCLFPVLLLEMAMPAHATVTYGTNLISNGDFESGNVATLATDGSIGFTSQYLNIRNFWNLSSEACYAIGTNPGDPNYGNPYFPNGSLAYVFGGSVPSSGFGDHTTGSGRMMIVNGSSETSKYVWQVASPIAVTAGSTYRFEAWTNTFGQRAQDNLAQLRFELSLDNGSHWQQLGVTTAVPNSAAWQQTFIDGIFASSGNASLRFMNAQPAAGGNDFAIDDIFVGVVTGASNPVSFTGNPGDNISGVPEIDPAGFGSVAALVTGALGLIERRRLKAKAA